jgi:hypothetical protein
MSPSPLPLVVSNPGLAWPSFASIGVATMIPTIGQPKIHKDRVGLKNGLLICHLTGDLETLARAGVGGHVLQVSCGDLLMVNT